MINKKINSTLLIILLLSTSVSLFSPSNVYAIAATGGAITYDGLYTVHTFTTTGTFTITQSGNVEYLVVAGGGGGSGKYGGGGGAGEFLTGTISSMAVGSYAVTIGSGGAGGLNTGANGGDGTNSVFSGVTTTGGGGGGNGGAAGNAGGSGGGGSNDAGAGGTSQAGGNDGGVGSTPGGGNYAGGGGGGAGAVGETAPSSAEAGDGGSGSLSSFSGASLEYSCGGGGSTWTGGTVGVGGCASAGDGGASNVNQAGGDGDANTGSGGGSASYASGAGVTGGAGGSGIVILRYLTITYPDAVTDLSSSSITTNSINLSWTEPNLNGEALIGYQINYTTPQSTTVRSTGTIFLNDTGVEDDTITGLSSGVAYSFTVSAWAGGGNNATFANVYNATILAGPTTPTNLLATASSDSVIGLDWDDAPSYDNILGFRIFSESPTGNGWTLEVNDTGTATSSYSDTGLTTKTQYNYMVAGINATSVGDNSTASSDYTWGVPDAITGFTIINPTGATLDPNYTAATSWGYAVTGYETLRDNIFLIYQGNVTTFTDASLSLATSYDYSIRALSSFGNSTWVNATGITATGPPTGLIVNDCYHTCTTQLNLDWVAPVPDTGVNGYRIFMETPIGNGFTLDVSNTTNTTLYYNDTGLTPGVFYNYKVAALNGGVSENSTAYAQTPHKLPDSVTDLVITPNSLLQFLGSWTAPSLWGTLLGYQINYTTPAGDPQTIYTSLNPGVTATISGLNPTVEYSFKVAANTYHGINATFGNIENATASSEIAVGDLDFDAGTNPDVEPIWFENYVVDSTTNNVQVRYDSALTVDCTITERVANNVNTYTGLSETAAIGYVYHNFTVTNSGNDILDWDCYDQTDALINGQYALSQDQSAIGVGGAGNIPLFSLMGNFTGGLYGTEGTFAGIDLITLFIVIISMLGFNKKNPALGVGVMATLLGAAWYYGLIPWTSGVLGALAVVLVLAIGQGIKRD